jgi:hypothetical protein
MNHKISSILRKIATEYLSKEEVFDLIVKYMNNKDIRALTKLEENFRDMGYAQVDAAMRRYNLRDPNLRDQFYNDYGFGTLRYVLDKAAPEFIPKSVRKIDVDDDVKNEMVNKFLKRMRIGYGAMHDKANLGKVMKEMGITESLDAPIKEEDEGRSKYEAISDVRSLTPRNIMVKEEEKHLIKDAINRLSPYEQYVIFRYFGIEPSSQNINKMESGLKIPRKVLIENLINKDKAKIPEIVTELKKLTGIGSSGQIGGKLKSGLSELSRHLYDLHENIIASKFSKRDDEAYKELVLELLQQKF